MNEIERKLRDALRAAVAEIRRNPSFIGRVVKSVADELGFDPLLATYVTGYLARRLRATNENETTE